MLTRGMPARTVHVALTCLLTVGCSHRQPAWPADEALPVDAGGAEGGPDTIAADTTGADALVGDPGWLLMLTGPGDVYFSHLALDERGNALVAAVFEQTALLGPKHQVTAVGGSDSHNFLVARVDPNGSVQWVVTGHGGPIAGLAADGTGGAYVVLGASKEATFGDQHLTGLPIGAVVVARLSTSGKVVWAVASGGDDGALGWTDVVGIPAGPVVAGAVEGQASLGGATLAPMSSNSAGYVVWLDAADGSALDSMVSSDLATPGYSPSTYFKKIVVDDAGDLRLGGDTGNNLFAAKIDSSGKPAWVEVAWGGGGSSYSFGGIDVGPAGQTYLAGSGACEKDYPLSLGSLGLPSCYNSALPHNQTVPERCFVAGLEHDGTPGWLVGSTPDWLVGSQVRCRSLSVAAAPGAHYLAGAYYGALSFGKCNLPTVGDPSANPVDAGTGLFLLRFDGAGTCERSVGPAGLARTSSAYYGGLDVATHQGKVWLAGGFNDTATFGPLGPRTATKTDGFLWRLPDPIP